MHHYVRVNEDQPDANCLMLPLLQLEARHGGERINPHVHLYVPAACALYNAPEDGCIWHPKHVEREKCNKGNIKQFASGWSSFTRNWFYVILSWRPHSW